MSPLVANLSPETPSFLVASPGFDDLDPIPRGLSHVRDIGVVELATPESASFRLRVTL